MKKYIIIGLLSLVTFSLQAQVNKVYWKETKGAKQTSPTSFQTLPEAVYSSAYSINELEPYQDGELKAILGESIYSTTLALVRKQDQDVLITGDTYEFFYNLDFYIRPSSQGYEVNGRKINMPVSPKDILRISRKGNLISFIVNDKTIHQVEAEESHSFPLVAAIYTSSKDEITDVFFTTHQDLIVEAETISVKGNILGEISIKNIYGGTAPYTYSWSHDKESTTHLKGLEQGNYTLTITDATGKQVQKRFQVNRELVWTKATNTKLDINTPYYHTANVPITVSTSSVIEENQNGSIEWSESQAKGNMYIGFEKREEYQVELKNNLLYAFLMHEKDVHVVFDGSIIKTFPRSKNRNTTYSIRKENGNIIYLSSGEVVEKQQIKSDVSLDVKVILLQQAKLTKLYGQLTTTDVQELENTINNQRLENQKQTTAYYKDQPVVWNNETSENTLPALRDGKVMWYGLPSSVWLETEDKTSTYKFEAVKEEKANYQIERNGYTMSFYKNDIFQYALSTNAEENLTISSTQKEDVTASFGRCSTSPNASPFGPTNIWYFGNRAGLNFDTSPPTAIESIMDPANEGCGIVSDYNGDVLFYTNGLKVWNKQNVLMENGEGLIGHTSSSQTGLIVPAPNNPNKYYIFHSTAMEIGATMGGIKVYFSTVIFDEAHPLGKVDKKNVLLSNELEERITAVKHSTSNAYWIVSHQRDNAIFSSYLLGAGGFIDPNDLSVLGDDPLPASKDSEVYISRLSDLKFPFWQGGVNDGVSPWYYNGQFKFSPNGKYLAVANNYSHNTSGEDYPGIYLMPYDASTGEVGDVLLAEKTNAESSYGIEFSPNSQFLYAMRKECNNNLHNPERNFGLFQYNIVTGLSERIADELDIPLITLTPGEIGYDRDRSECYGAMQLGNDGKIYVTRAGSEMLGVINAPNIAGGGPTGADYRHNGVSLSVGATAHVEQSLYGFPSFVQSFLPCPELVFNQTSIGPINASSYQLAVTDFTNIDPFQVNNYTYEWSTGETTPSITVTTTGTYTLTIKYNNISCNEICSYSGQVEVILEPSSTTCEEPLEITDTYSCNSYTITAEDGFQDYEWNTGETERSIVVQNAGEYVVTAFDPILNCTRKGIFYASFNEFCYDEIPANVSTTEYKEVLSVSVVNYSDIWLKKTNEQTSKNPFLNAQKGVWRADASFAYVKDRSASEDVDVSKDGTFELQMLDWQQNGNLYPNDWKKVATLEQYNAEGFEVENRDILGRYSSALYGYQNQLSTAVATNAKYHEIVFDGFEEYTPSNFRNADRAKALTTSNLDIFRVDPTETNFSVQVPVYRHYHVAWGTSNSAVVETSTGRNLNNFNASLKVVPVSNDVPKIVDNVDFTLNTTGIRLSQANFQNATSLNLPSRWKGNIAFSTEATVSPIYDLGTEVDIAQGYAHTGKKSLKVTQNVSYEQVRFDPAPGRQYIVSLWVSVKDADVPTFTSDEEINQTASRRGITIKFEGSTEEFFFEPKGRIIEGWQRIEGVFCVPQQYDKLYLTLQTGNETTYFDDIRFHPFNGNLQTYVYDPENYLLRAVLDRNNFATFYYYDSEQQLRLVKKETERGVKTIQEVISNMPSKEN